MPTPGDQNCIAVCSVGVRPIELKWNSDLLQKKLTTPCFKGVSVLLIFFLLWNQLLISLISVVFLDLISLVSAYIFNFLAVLVFCLICPSFSNFFFFNLWNYAISSHLGIRGCRLNLWEYLQNKNQQILQTGVLSSPREPVVKHLLAYYL